MLEAASQAEPAPTESNELPSRRLGWLRLAGDSADGNRNLDQRAGIGIAQTNLAAKFFYALAHAADADP